MAVTAHVLASGPGWRVSDVVCAHGPGDPRFEEQHTATSIAAVIRGTFQYRSRHGSAVLVPGALLLGNAGACFECGHEHGHGDRCLSFQYTPGFLESQLAGDVRAMSFVVPSLPPLPQLAPLIAEAEAGGEDTAAFEELALRLAGAVVSLAAQTRPRPDRHAAGDERRITAAVRRIDSDAADETLSLSSLARDAAMSPYHFLRTFRRVAGMTPHQFILRTRLHRAAVRLRRTDDAISAIAYDAGFNDLSTFNRRFRRVMGSSPGLYRAGHGSLSRRHP